MKKLLALIALCLAFAHPASAQTFPYSGSITIAGTYQTVVAPPRYVSCSFQNTGTHNMWLFFCPPGATCTPTHATSVLVPAGGAVSCSASQAGVQQDTVSVDGTTADTFYANQE